MNDAQYKPCPSLKWQVSYIEPWNGYIRVPAAHHACLNYVVAWPSNQKHRGKHHTHSEQPTSVQVVLLDRSIWNSRGSGMPAVAVMSAHGEFGTSSGTSDTGVRIYGASGCADTACRNAGWTVEHSLVVLTSLPATAMGQLHTDAAAIHAHLKEAYSQQLQAGEYAVNIQITLVGTNEGYQVDTQVRSSTALSRVAAHTSASGFAICVHSGHASVSASFVKLPGAVFYRHSRTCCT